MKTHFSPLSLPPAALSFSCLSCLSCLSYPFWAGACLAQDSATGPPLSPYRLLAERGAYLQAITEQEGRVKAAPKGEERAGALQQLAGCYTFVGDTNTAQILMEQSQREQGAPPRRARQYPYEAGLSPRPAVSAIVRAAEDKQIVILNENHSTSQNRAFAMLLAQALRKEGFTYFAAETFAPPATLEETKKRGYPDRKTGYYTLDPVFGDLVRQAQRMGYKLVAYETEDRARPADFVEAINARETAQAHNLFERIFKNDPKARVLLYVGFSHASEAEEAVPDGRAIAWMASRLKKETGIDPLTIDQSELFEPSGTNGINGTNAQGSETTTRVTPVTPVTPVERFRIRQPSIVCRVDGSSWRTGTGAGTMDLQVFHPFVREQNGRPDWLQMNGYRKPLSVDAALIPAAGRVLLQAFVASENREAPLPVDQTLLTAGKPAPVLMLPKGTYRLVVQDETGFSRPAGVATQK